MNTYVKPALLLAMLCIAISSCKLDAPVLPGDPNYVPYTPDGSGTNTGNTGGGTITGNSGTGNNVNNSVISGNWTVKATRAGVYNQNNTLLSGAVTFNLFSGVTISETTKAIEFIGSFTAVGPGTYTLAATASTLHVQLSKDPFARSINDRLQVTNLTANSMTWVAIDPQTITTNGQALRTGFEVTFTK